jgi:aryl-alcohol dehydrogenase
LTRSPTFVEVLGDKNIGEEIMDITAAVLRDAGGAFNLERVSLAAPRQDEVLVRLVAVGICHTDVAVRDRHLPSPLPIVLGHEGAGYVEAVGPAVTTLKPGDPVVLTYLNCGECPECLAGETASCSRLGPACFSGARPDGSHALCGSGGEVLHDRFFGQSSFATHAIAHERNAVKVPQAAPLALLGPLGCGVMTGAGVAWNALKIGPGSSFAVFGAGAVGLSAVMAARVAGAVRIIAVDKVPGRLALAKEVGATHVLEAGNGDIVAAIKDLGGNGVDFALDTTGRTEIIQSAVRALRQRGVAAFVAGSKSREVTLDLSDMLVGCKTVKGVIEGGGSAKVMIPKLVDLHMAGAFPFDKLVKFYALSEINDAVEDSLSGKVIKPILRIAA